VLRGGVKEPWGPHWEKLLAALQPAVPAGWTVLVLSDRGLESAGLFRFIQQLGWHPLMRVKKGGKFKPHGWGRFYALQQLVRRVGAAYAAAGIAYTGEKLRCTLLACWTEGHAEPWLLLTDLPPEAGHAVWYGLRAWIEQGFKVIKGGGWDWHKTRMEDPERVERLWLVLAVATLWVVALGAEDEHQERLQEQAQRLARELDAAGQQAQARQAAEQQRLQQQRAAQQQRQERLQKRRTAQQQARAQKAKAPRTPATAPRPMAQPRTHRLSVRGLAVWQAAWQRGVSPLPQHLHPEPWPPPTHAASTLTEQEFLSQQT
jgi:hypothetical protein